MSDPRDILKQRLARELKSRSMREMLEDQTFVAQLANHFPEIISEFASMASVATGLDAKATHSVPLLLDFTHPDGTKRAAVVSLTLMYIPTAAPQHWEGWVSDPESAAIQIDPEFKESLTGTRDRLKTLDPNYPLWPENANFHIRWHISQDAHVGMLSGRSADCIIALGIIELLRKTQLISPDHSLSSLIGTWTPASWRGLSASVQMDEHGIMLPVPTTPLQRKVASSINGSVDTILVRLPPDQGHLSAAQAASSPELVNVTSLQQAVFYLAMRGQPASAAKQRSNIRRRVFFSVIAVCVLLALSTACWWGLWVSYPSAGVLRQRLPMATIDQSPLPANCKHLIVLSKLSKEVWTKQVFPVLKNIKSSYALVIGNPRELPNDADQFALDGLDELKRLRSLVLLGAGVNALPGLDQLDGLEQLIIVNSCVKSVMYAAGLPNLRILVLDSPWIKAVPKDLSLPQAEVIIIHTDCRNGDISVGSIKLRTLVVHSEHLNTLILNATSERSSFLKLEVEAPHLDCWGCDHTVPSLRELTLIGLPPSRDAYVQLDLSAFPRLEELRVKGGLLKDLKGISGLSSLRVLDIENTQNLEVIGIEQLINLKILRISVAPKIRLANIAALTILQDLTAECNISSLSGLDQLKAVKTIFLNPTQGGMPELPSLSELKQLESLNVSGGQIKNVPELGSNKQCTVTISGETVQYGRNRNVIKKKLSDQLVWHPDDNGWFEVKEAAPRNDYFSTYYTKIDIDGAAFFIDHGEQPGWSSKNPDASTEYDVDRIEWKHILDDCGIRIGCDLGSRK